MTSKEQPADNAESTQASIKGDREHLNNKLNALDENMTQAEYLSLLLTALSCRIIDENFYIKYRDMGFTQGIPFKIMALDLRNKLLEILSNPVDAGETAPEISAGISDAANSITG